MRVPLSPGETEKIRAERFVAHDPRDARSHDLGPRGADKRGCRDPAVPEPERRRCQRGGGKRGRPEDKAGIEAVVFDEEECRDGGEGECGGRPAPLAVAEGEPGERERPDDRNDESPARLVFRDRRNLRAEIQVSRPENALHARPHF